jgi:hypothetical protein
LLALLLPPPLDPPLDPLGFPAAPDDDPPLDAPSVVGEAPPSSF